MIEIKYNFVNNETDIEIKYYYVKKEIDEALCRIFLLLCFKRTAIAIFIEHTILILVFVFYLYKRKMYLFTLTWISKNIVKYYIYISLTVLHILLWQGIINISFHNISVLCSLSRYRRSNITKKISLSEIINNNYAVN